MPGTFRGFDYPPMAAEATADLRRRDARRRSRRCPRATRRPCRRTSPALDDWRWLFYSSGTTADPKGAKHSDRSLSAANDSMQWGMQVTGDDKTAVVFPITHVGGLVWLFNTMQTGVELLMVETFDPSRDAERGSASTAVTCAGAGTVFWLAYLAAQRALPAGERVLPDVRIFNGGGAPKPVTLNAELLAAFGAPLLNGWGITESPINTMVARRRPRRSRRPSTEGRAGPGVRAPRRARRPRAAAPARRASCSVQGPQVCMGYLDSSLDADAFDRRRLVPHRRPRHRSTTSGYVVHHRPAQGHHHPQGREHLGQGDRGPPARAPEDRRGRGDRRCPTTERARRACAVIVLAPGADRSRCARWSTTSTARQLSKHKIPEQLEIVDALPRNPTGKILKKDLRTTYGGTA